LKDSSSSAEVQTCPLTWNILTRYGTERGWKGIAALVERLMDDEYLYIAPNGRLMDRETILGVIRSPNYRLDNSTRTPILIKTVSEDAAVMVFQSLAAGAFEGTSFKDNHVCTMLCVRRGGEWRVFLEQCSPNIS
jgi:hypothetical protein